MIVKHGCVVGRGWTQPGAAQLCADYRAKGGACFVRENAGDQAVNWKK